MYSTTLCHPSQAITVGRDPTNTLVLEEAAHWKSLEIVRVFHQGTAQLRFDDRVTGHVKLGNKLVSLATIRLTNQAVADDSGLFTVPFNKGERADIVIGHVSFFFDWIGFDEPPLPRPLGMDIGEKKDWLVSVGILLLLLGSIFVVGQIFGPKNDEKEGERIVTLLPRTPPPPPPKPAKAAMGERKTVDGGAQKGPPGKVATKAVEKPSAAEQMRKANLGSLVSGLTSIGSQAPTVTSNVNTKAAVNQVGTGGFTTQGLDTGGGGKTQGLGRTVGQGEGGFEGTGRLGLSGSSAVEGTTGHGAPETVVKGGLSSDVIESIIRRRQYRIRLCYERELNYNPKLAGKIAVHFVIGPKGEVKSATVSEDTMKSENVKKCVINEVKTWTFPNPEGGTLVNVDYPFVFESSARTGQ